MEIFEGKEEIFHFYLSKKNCFKLLFYRIVQMTVSNDCFTLLFQMIVSNDCFTLSFL
jgi:hypothetical protein